MPDRTYTIVDYVSDPYSSTESEVRKELQYWLKALEEEPEDEGIIGAVADLQGMLKDVKQRDSK